MIYKYNTMLNNKCKYNREQLSYKVNKYQNKLKSCNMVNDAELYNNKIAKYTKMIKYGFQTGGDQDDVIYNNILKEFEKMDSTKIMDINKIVKEVSKFSEKGKARYGRVVEQALKLYKVKN